MMIVRPPATASRHLRTWRRSATEDLRHGAFLAITPSSTSICCCRQIQSTSPPSSDKHRRKRIVPLLIDEPTRLPRCLPTSAQVHIWVGQLEPRNPNVLSPQELDRARQYLTVSTRNSYISRTVMLRQIIGHYLNIPPEAVQLSSERWSRPRLVTGPDLCFSVSKVAGLAVFAFRLGGKLGVDIEITRPELNPTALAKRFLTIPEQADLAKVPSERRGDVLIQAWTRKEAYVKGLGAGLRHALNGFETGIEGSWRPVVDPSMSGPTWWVRDLPPLDGARLALATAGSQTEVVWFRCMSGHV